MVRDISHPLIFFKIESPARTTVGFFGFGLASFPFWGSQYHRHLDLVPAWIVVVVASHFVFLAAVSGFQFYFQKRLIVSAFVVFL